MGLTGADPDFEVAFRAPQGREPLDRSRDEVGRWTGTRCWKGLEAEFPRLGLHGRLDRLPGSRPSARARRVGRRGVAVAGRGRGALLAGHGRDGRSACHATRPNGLPLNPVFMRLFNRLYHARHGKVEERRVVSYEQFFYRAGRAPRLEPPLRRTGLPPVSVRDSPLGRTRPRARAAPSRTLADPLGRRRFSRSSRISGRGLGCVSVFSARGDDAGARRRRIAAPERTILVHELNAIVISWGRRGGSAPRQRRADRARRTSHR